MKAGYPSEVEAQMVTVYERLSECDRRLYAAVEVSKLGHGGLTYICNLLGCCPNKVYQGQKDLNSELAPASLNRTRRPGGGRKSAQEEYPELDDVFLDVLKEHTAGDPMDEQVKWTHLKKPEIVDKLRQRGIQVSRNIVSQLLAYHGYKKRSLRKSKAIGQNEQRNEQFENISRLKAEYEANGDPVISIDTKKRAHRFDA